MDASEQRDMLISVQTTLKDSIYACKSLEKLSGGSANFVYRGTLEHELQDGSKTIVVKHSAPYVASNKSFELTTDRSIYEHKIISALEALPPSLHYNISVQSPKALNFSESTNTQIMSDLSSSIDLKNYLLTQTLTHHQSSQLGYALGLWAKRFHQWGAASEQNKLRLTIKGNQDMKDLKFRINYDRLLVKVYQYPDILQESRSLFEFVKDDARKTFESDVGSLGHGDFWTGNVLLKNEPFPEEQRKEALSILIVDWELSHLNSIVFDLGQMFAELFQVKHFKNYDSGVWIIAAFMEGYGKIEADQAFKVAIHMGTHFICWGSSVQGWGTEEQVLQLVKLGKDYIVNGWKKSKVYFEETPLRCLFQD